MRKFLAGLMAVMMLASVLALSVGAATKTFDESTADDAKNLDLIITEVMTQSKNPQDFADSSDLYEYIEIYNRGDSVVNLADYCLVRCDSTGVTDAVNPWKQQHKFTNVLNLVANNIENDNALDKSKLSVSITNPRDINLQPGQFAVIWIWNDDNEQFCKDNNENLAAADNNRKNSAGQIVSFPKFRDAYSSSASTAAHVKNADGTLDTVKMSDDTLVMVAMGATKEINKNGFRLANGGLNMYALATKSVGASIAADGYTTQNAINNPNIICLFEWGTSVCKGGIPQIANPGYSTIYVPANQVPYMINRGAELNKKSNEEIKTYTDYVEYAIAMGYEGSYKEASVMTYWERPTPGYMMPYQWAYVDPARTPESVKNYIYDKNLDDEALIMTTTENTHWNKDMYTFLEEARLITGDDGSGEDETKRDEIDYKTQEELKKQNDKTIKNQQNTNTKKGLPVWALILIIVGGVVVLGGVAVVVILVLKKKNKPVAADDVAAEGEVKIIDEGAGEEKAEEPKSDDTKSE